MHYVGNEVNVTLRRAVLRLSLHIHSAARDISEASGLGGILLFMNTLTSHVLLKTQPPSQI